MLKEALIEQAGQGSLNSILVHNLNKFAKSNHLMDDLTTQCLGCTSIFRQTKHISKRMLTDWY